MPVVSFFARNAARIVIAEETVFRFTSFVVKAGETLDLDVHVCVRAIASSPGASARLDGVLRIEEEKSGLT